VVFPPLAQNANPPPLPSVANAAPPAVAAPAPTPTNGTLPSSEPRRIKTLSVRGDQADAAAVPAPPPAAAKPTRSASAAQRGAPAAAANAPLSLAPDAQASARAAEPRRVATLQPPPGAPGTGAVQANEGRFLVSILSQPTEAEAQAAFRSMQKKHPEQLGSHSPVIKRVDGKKGVTYRAMVGPFASHEEATRFCTNYSSAGGQCWVP
jgi:hypothetical protein